MKERSNMIGKYIMTLLVLLMTAATATAQNKPVLNIEVCEGRMYGVYVKGWAYDPDVPDERSIVEMSVYVTADMISNPHRYLFISFDTNLYERPDVNAQYGLTGKHGFELREFVDLEAFEEYGHPSYYVVFEAKDLSGDESTSITIPVTPGPDGVPKFDGLVLELTPESGEYKIGDGCVLKGTGGKGTCILIEDGATVTLSGVELTGFEDNIYFSNWAGLTCLGNATIILADGTSNAVWCGHTSRPGIQAGPPGTTLTIRGNGALNAYSRGHGAGIGSGYDSCGNIVIEGGDITATAGYKAWDEKLNGWYTVIGNGAGIGAGYGTSCGNITITGGSITATSYKDAGIGSGYKGTCGDITIAGERIRVTATKGSNAPYSIGAGVSDDDGTSTCGTVTIGGVVTDGITESTYIFAPTNGSCTISFNANKGAGTMDPQQLTVNTPQALTACSYTRDYYSFSGWNTGADGRGMPYADGVTVSLINNLTLYAQWTPVTYNINYELDGGTNDDSNPAAYTVESDAITLAEPTRPSFTFEGWTYEEQVTPVKSVTIPHGSHRDITFTAHWSVTPLITLTENTKDVILYNGQSLTGTGGPDTHIVIADGATVTLSGVNVTGIKDDFNHRWAGISCQGNATIVLKEETANYVKSGNGDYPGIYVPKNRTLTIRGSGSLEAGSKWHGAGIGGGRGIECGNIVIEGGSITANGGKESAGIGGGCTGSCGNITITDGVTSITATKGQDAPYSIGAGAGSMNFCGTVTIGGTVTGSIPQSPFTYNPSDTTPYTVTFNANGGKGTMANEAFTTNTPQALTTNAFTREYYTFAGWNTDDDGSGFSFADGQTIISLGDATLYAQWTPVIYSIIYELGGGTNSSANPSTYTIESDAITLANPVYYGFTFDGWTYEGQDTPTKSVTIPHGSHSILTFTAHWTGLSSVELTAESGTATFVDSQIITGTGGANTHISIAAGATVILRDVNITDIPYDYNHKWAGITCLGDATLIFEGTNTVKGGYNGAGIQAGPTGTTLTILNHGTLTATGSPNGAGIGSGSNRSCGNIVINGGTITANGGNAGAGIGSGYSKSTCGTITINGGTVTANGGDSGAGIGSGYYYTTCGTITINGGTVTANDGGSGAGIGSGRLNSTCGDIVINGGTVTANGGDSGASSGAGIGSGGLNSTCGTVTITSGVTRVAAKRGNKYADCIGAGRFSSCGTVSIAAELMDMTEGDTKTLSPGITFAKEGYSTYFDSKHDATLPTGMKAHIVTATADGGQLTYETIADGSTDDKTVPAGTAVMLQVAGGDEEQTLGLTLTTPKATDISQTNLLGGSDEATTPTDGSKLYYKLTYGDDDSDYAGVFGWFWGKENGEAFESSAHRAYLAVPKSANARSFALPGASVVSGITAPSPSHAEEGNGSGSATAGRESNAPWFTLDGRRIARPTAPGLYIQGGKKVVIP